MSVTIDEADPVAASGPARWAANQLIQGLADADDSETSVVLAGFDAPPVRSAFAGLGLAIPAAAESLALMQLGDGSILAAGRDPRGLAYATLELVDRLRQQSPLRFDRPIVQSPANEIRGVARLFVSDAEDLPWFHDHHFWDAYLTHLAMQRFNRIQLAFGIGHDFLRNVLDAYLLFAYPFLVDVPGYGVSVPGLSAEERQRNLQSLRYASDAAAERGLHFQLGIWTHADEWTESPRASHVIEGLTPESHAGYCRDALRSVLQACPSIAGVTLRVHGESGVPEGNYDFWREVFQGIVTCGRPVELDLHPKGVGQAMIDVAVQTGLTVRLSPKYTAEHMGLPGHQVAIRELERTGDTHRQPDTFVDHLMNQSGAELRYTRYGNADFLREDRPYGVYYRIWPGTQRLLLWGDPALASGLGRSGSFCGAQGIEICEPLSFKGRRGSGLPGGREAYADSALQEDGGRDWQKYSYTYRVFGRLLYDPNEDADVWQRALVHDFGAAGVALGSALAHASRILPLVTSAYHPSAANNRYWPEMYTNLPIVDPESGHPYRDTPSPRRFGTASPLDPGLFSGVDEFVAEALARNFSGRVSPPRVARTMDALADRAAAESQRAVQLSTDPTAPRFRRVAVDVAIQAALGRFFAAKLRSGVAFALWRATDEADRLQQAVREYRAARGAWCEAIEHGRVYRDDITVGGEPWLRGHWADRLAAIDADLSDMESLAANARPAQSAAPLDELEPVRPALRIVHQAPSDFARGAPVVLHFDVSAPEPHDVELHYRHVNQAESYECVRLGNGSDAVIPSSYTDSPFPLQYFLVIRHGGGAWREPDLADDLANQPYWVIRQRRSG